jgi:hypothetical protein
VRFAARVITHQVGLGSLLQGKNGRRLKPQIVLEILGNLFQSAAMSNNTSTTDDSALTSRTRR